VFIVKLLIDNDFNNKQKALTSFIANL